MRGQGGEEGGRREEGGAPGAERVRVVPPLVGFAPSPLHPHWPHLCRDLVDAGLVNGFNLHKTCNETHPCEQAPKVRTVYSWLQLQVHGFGLYPWRQALVLPLSCSTRMLLAFVALQRKLVDMADHTRYQFLVHTDG